MRKNIHILTIIIISLLISCNTKQLNGKRSKYTSFTPGAIWEDNEGNHINAHGGGILYHNNTYYWFGNTKEKV